MPVTARQNRTGTEITLQESTQTAAGDLPETALGEQPLHRDFESDAADPDFTAPTVDPTPSEIAERAYSLYQARGGQDGYDVDDWLEAERSLRGMRNRRAGEDRPS